MMPRNNDTEQPAVATSLDTFVEPTDWSTVPEPYDDPSQDPDAPVGDQ